MAGARSTRKPQNEAQLDPPAKLDTVDVVEEPQHLIGDDEIELIQGGDDYELDGALGGIDLSLPSDGSMTTTNNFMNPAPTIVDEVQEMRVTVVENEPKKRVVVVVEDVGPVYYGADIIELKKGQKYRVPEHIFRYLNEKNLIWSVG